MAETYEPPRPWIINIGKRLRPMVDSVVARNSDVPNDPVLDPADFPYTAELEKHWETIRDEALAISVQPNRVPALDEISPDHQGIAPAGMWRSFFLVGYGYPVEENLARCPKTAEIVSRIPGLNSAFFSILKAGTHIPDHRGVTKGLITCHLGLSVPEEGDCRMRVHDQVVRWENGKTLVFDDTYRHEVWNDTDERRVVLLLHIERPERFPGSLVRDAFIAAARHSPFIQDVRRNIDTWRKDCTVQS